MSINDVVVEVLREQDNGPLSTNELFGQLENVERSQLFQTLKDMERKSIVLRKGGVDNNGTLGFLWTLNPQHVI